MENFNYRQTRNTAPYLSPFPFDRSWNLVNNKYAYLVYRDMHDKHLSFEIDLLYFRPAEMLYLPWVLERQNPTVVNAEMKLRALVGIL